MHFSLLWSCAAVFVHAWATDAGATLPQQSRRRMPQQRLEDRLYTPQTIHSSVCQAPIPDVYTAWCEEHPLQARSATTPTEEARGPTTGHNVTALVLLVRFPEHASRQLPSPTYIDTLCNTNMSNYLRRQSYGKYSVQRCHVATDDWFTVPYSQALYSNTLSNLVGHEYASSFFLPALDHWAETHQNNTHLWSSTLDSNQDGAIDIVLVFHSGYGAEFGRGAACGVEDARERIHSQGHVTSPPDVWSVSFFGNRSSSSRLRLGGYAITSAFEWVCEDTPATLGIATHEWVHTLGVGDLYGMAPGGLGGVASWGLMGGARGMGRDGHPSGMTAYAKWKVGWIDTFQNVTENGEYELRPLNYYPEAYAIHVGFATDEFLLLENRQAVDDDIELFGGGLLIYHVNGRKRSQGTSGYPGVEGWPENLDVYKIALLQADGAYDLERGKNNGDAGDLWSPGMSLGPRSPGERFPNTDSYINGPTGIAIDVLQSAIPENVRFRISGLRHSEPPASEMTPHPSMYFPSASGTAVLSTTAPSPLPTLQPSAQMSPTQPPTVLSTTSPSPFPTSQPFVQIRRTQPPVDVPSVLTQHRTSFPVANDASGSFVFTPWVPLDEPSSASPTSSPRRGDEATATDTLPLSSSSPTLLRTSSNDAAIEDTSGGTGSNKISQSSSLLLLVSLGLAFAYN